MSVSLISARARASLAPRREPYYVRLGDGVSLGLYVGAKGGRWTARVVNPVGRPKWLTATIGAESSLSYAEASDAARAWAAVAVVPSHDPTPTVRQAVDSWVAGKAADNPRAASKTRAGWQSHADRLAAFLGEGARLSDVTAADLTRFRDRPADRGAVRAAATGNRDLAAAKAMLTAGADAAGYQGPRAWQDARAHSSTVVNLARADQTDAADGLGGRALGLDDMRLFLESAAEFVSPEFATFCRVMFLTMQRPRALMMADCRDFYSRDGRCFLRLRYGKNSRKRGAIEIELFDEVAALLIELTDGRPRNAPILTDETGARWSEDFQRYRFPRALDAAGIDPEGLTFYSLRHSGISWAALPLAQGGGGLDVLTIAQCADSSPEIIGRHYFRRQTVIGPGPGL